MPLKNHKKSKTNKNHKRPKKGHKSPKKSPPRRNDVVNDNPVSPSLGDPNAFNFLLEKHASAVEVFMKYYCVLFLHINLILSSYSHMLSSYMFIVL
jgi:hypothetical protein